MRERFRPCWWLAIVYVVLGAMTRVALLVMTGKGVRTARSTGFTASASACVSDLITFIYVAWPMVLFLWMVPARRARISSGQWAVSMSRHGAAVCRLPRSGVACAGTCTCTMSWPLVILFLFFLPMPALAYSSTQRPAGMYLMPGVAVRAVFRRSVRAGVLERVQRALQLHRGGLSGLHHGSNRQYPRVISDLHAGSGCW
jgi:hypothetical protein